uniref:Leucine-rich repeat-containing N-terminal plant-type domain-containing protein n=1 Tax=Oryza barthii TaxID=65489 RepID=A0A0D3GPX0_9ORYZ
MCTKFCSLQFHHLISDGEALLAFKKAITTSEGIFLNWCEQDVDPCNWKGVRCDSHTKRVIYLIEPLVCEYYISKCPVIVPYHRGGKRIHVGVQELTISLKILLHGLKLLLASSSH